MILWDNVIGDEGAKYVADMLRVNTSLRELCLSYGQIGHVGFEHLSDALAVNTTLRILDVGGDITIYDKHLRKLCPGLRVNGGLETLDVRRTNITNEGVKCIEEVLCDNFYLKKVALSQPDDDEAYIDMVPGTSWSRVLRLLKLNQYNRKIVKDEEAILSDWLESVIQGSQNQQLDFSYFFLRNKPELCRYYQKR